MANFKFICGPDDFLVQKRARDLWAPMVKEINDEYSCEIIDGATNTVDDVGLAVSRFGSAVQTLSLFGTRKAVWFKDITFLADSVTGRSQGTQEHLEVLQDQLENIDSASVLVLLSASPVDRRKKTFKWFQKKGDYEFLDPSKGNNDIGGIIQEEAGKLDVQISPAVIEVLVAKLNGNSRLALEETRKLATYLGREGGEITESLVSEMVPNFGEGDFFETVEAFYSGDLEWTLAAIRRHFFAGHDARPMIASLQNRNRLLVQLSSLRMAGKLPSRPSKASLESLARDYSDYFKNSDKSTFNVFTQNPWYLGKLSSALDHFHLRQLVEFQEEFVQAFRGIITRYPEQESVMRETAIRCLAV